MIARSRTLTISKSTRFRRPGSMSRAQSALYCIWKGIVEPRLIHACIGKGTVEPDQFPYLHWERNSRTTPNPCLHWERNSRTRPNPCLHWQRNCRTRPIPMPVLVAGPWCHDHAILHAGQFQQKKKWFERTTQSLPSSLLAERRVTRTGLGGEVLVG